MNSQLIQQNGQRIITLLLVVFVLAVGAIPALVWDDAGEGGSQQKTVTLNDDEMGILSLKVTQRTAVAPEVPASVEVDDAEITGYFSLNGGHYVKTTGGQPAQVQVDDEEMGFLSLKVTGHPADTSAMSELAQGQ